MKKYQITVNGNVYEVEVEEVSAGAATTAVATPAPAPVVVPKAAPAAPKATAPAAGEFAVVSENGEANAEVEALIRARADAKKAKNFAEADRIRDELKAQGIEVTDIPNGAKWKRV